MILVGIGANLPSQLDGGPLATCEAAIEAMNKAGISVVRRSNWYESAPLPPSPQPWYVNGVAEVASELEPAELLDLLHRIEDDFGRRRSAKFAARTLDLDLLAVSAMVMGPGGRVELPHPRMHERAFVLLPLAELEPGWVHPRTGRKICDLIGALPPGQTAVPLKSRSPLK